MKKILYFFPENPLEQNAGNKTRALQLLEYFKSRDLHVDLVSQRLPWASPWTEQDVNDLLGRGLAANVRFVRKKPSKKPLANYLFRYKFPQLRYEKARKKNGNSLPPLMSFQTMKEFEEILEQERYDLIVISYVYWADLLSNKKLLRGARTIVDTHDFATVQHKNEPGFNLGATFEEEIRRLNLFDEVWVVSADEAFLFGQFCENKVRLVPVMLESPEASEAKHEKEYDLVYVASDNPHNRLSVEWFFREVYPLLPSSVRICVAGKITEFAPEQDNIYKIPFVEDLDSLYNRSRVVLCPMFTGTGVKVKVVEALAHGLPVVCTPRGTDGLPGKSNNGCLVSEDPREFAKNCADLLTDASLYGKQQALARDMFYRYFELGKCYAELDRILGIDKKQSEK